MTTPLTTRRARRARTAGAALVAALALTVAPLTTAQAAPSPAPSASASTAGGAAARWTTRDVSAQKAVDSVSITADGTVDLLRVTSNLVGDVTSRWTAALYRQSRSGKTTHVRTFTGSSVETLPSLRTGEDGSSILVIPAPTAGTRASVRIRRNGSTTWINAGAPSGALAGIAADTQKNGTITVAFADGQSLRTSTRAPGKGWSKARTVVTTPSLGDGFYEYAYVHLDVTANGAATVAIDRFLFTWDGTELKASLYAASRTASASAFGRATKLASTYVRNVSVAQAGKKSIVAWSGENASGVSRALVRTRSSATSSWSRTQALATAASPGSGWFDVTVAGSPDGRATLVHTGHDAKARVRVLSRGKDTSFSKPVLTVTRARTALLAQRHNGAATLVTVTGDASATTGTLAVRTSNKAGTRWSKASTLGTAVTGWEGTQSLAVARSGATVVAWVAKTSGTRSHLVASHR